MTNPPTIVGEQKKEYKDMPPPPENRIIFPRGKSGYTFEVYITKASIDRILAHCKAYADRMLEVMGFLVGDVYKWKGHVFSLVKDVVTSDLKSSNISVRFADEGYEGLFGKLDDLDYDYVIVGWYHSHPGLGCFLSSTDIETQKKTFNMPYHTALVVDPVKTEMKAYRLREQGYSERTYAIYYPKRIPGLK